MKGRTRMNYVNLPEGGYEKTTEEIGWVKKDGKWWAVYAYLLEWFQKEDRKWMQRYKRG